MVLPLPHWLGGAAQLLTVDVNAVPLLLTIGDLFTALKIFDSEAATTCPRPTALLTLYIVFTFSSTTMRPDSEPVWYRPLFYESLLT